MRPPIARKHPHRLEVHGDVRVDDYYWLRQRDNPAVTAYVEAENAYLSDRLSHTEDLQARLFEEIKSRIKQTDASVPFQDGTHLYSWRVEDGKEYRIYCRKPLHGGQEEVILNVNTVAEGHEFCDVALLTVSPNEKVLAYAADTVGRRRYTIYFRDLDTGTTFADVVPNVTSNAVWANDSHTLFYTRQHPETLRAFQIYRHRLGEDVPEDDLVYEETDETFTCGVGKSRSKRYVVVASNHTLTSEYRFLDADDPGGTFTVFLPRQKGHEYDLDHYRGRFLIRSNADARNFRLLETDDRQLARAHWRELIPHRDDVLLETFEMFRDHLVVQERTDGLVRLRIHPWIGEGHHDVEFSDPTYDAYIDAHNRVPDTQVLRFGYSSLRTPESTYDYDMVTREQTLLKRDEVLGDFTPENYRTERLYATARDGTRIPISLVARTSTPRDGTNPLLLYGYGAYGISADADFYSPRLSLLDRGFIFAIAHVRGGEELGRALV